MDKKTYTIGVLSITGLLLFLANLMVPTRSAVAEAVIKDRDYIAVTARTGRGGDALYLTDIRTGMMAVFSYDPGRRGLRVLDVKPVMAAFGAGGGGGADEGGNQRRGNR